MVLRILALCSLVFVSVSGAHADQARLADAKAQKAAVKCQKAIEQSGAKLFAAKLKSLDACATVVLACVQTKPGDAACVQKAAAKCSKSLLSGIPQAEVGASAKIVKSCGAPLRPADLLASDGLGIGAQAAACNADFGLNVCANLPTLAQCLVATGSRGAERLYASQQPRARELIEQALSPVPLTYLPAFPGCQDCAQAPSDTLGKAVTACGATLTKAGRSFASAVGKGLAGCIDRVFVCVQTKPGDIKCIAKAATACDVTVAKLAAARGKLASAIDQRCADTSLLPFATLAAAAALNLDALTDDCAALGVAALGTVDDYVECLRRQHECTVADVLRQTLPRTSSLVADGLLGAAVGELLDAASCPTSLPSAARSARPVPRSVGLFSMAKFFGVLKKSGFGAGTKATTVSAPAPPSAPNGVRRVFFSQGAPSRFVPGFGQIVKVSYTGTTRTFAARAALGALPPTLIIGVTRSDLVVEDHLEIPLDDVPEGGTGEVELEIDYDAAPPSCVFDVSFAVDEDGEVSDYTTVEVVADTVPPPTATPTPAPQSTATAAATIAPTATTTALATATATGTSDGTATTTPSATAPTPTATPTAAFAYALTTNDDPAAPGTTAVLTLTVTNLTNAPQNATLSFTVPAFTTFGAFGAGAVRNVVFSNVAAGASQSALIPLVLTSGGAAPPDGTVVTVTFLDAARGASVARTFVTDAAPAATLASSTADATVAAGGTFTYALDYHNAEVGPLDGAELSIAVPLGASFLSAEGGVTPGLDGIVRWPLGTLAGNATGRRTATFAAGASTRAPLVAAAELHDGNAGLAHASAAIAVYAAPTFAYTLTTSDDAVAPGRTALFRLTVTNLGNAPQNATVSFAVPRFTTYGAFGAGAVRSVAFSNVAAGASQSAVLPLVVTSGAAAPPDGTVLALAVVDGARGAVASQSVVVQSAPSAELTLANPQGTVGPGDAFTYTLAYDNPRVGALADVEASVRVPAGATFVSADAGVSPDPDGVVRWPIGTLAGNASGQRRVTFAAGANARAPLVVEAALRNGVSGAIVTRASDAAVVAATPVFAYTLTTTDDAVAPGDTAVFRLTVTNLTNAAQDATLALRVPDFTTYGAFGAGAVRSVAFAGVAAGASQSALLPLIVTSGAAAPPDGTVIGLAVHDGGRGAAVARTVIAHSAPRAELTLATTAGTVAAGGTFSYTLAFHNPRSAPLPAAELGVRIPEGATFVSAEEGIAPDADGVVRWPIGTLPGNTAGQRRVTFMAAADARAPMLVEADVHDGGTHEVVTQASAATTVAANPVFAYTLTTTDDDPIVPGRVASYLLTVTNLTNAVQNATLLFRVPDFTTYGAFGAGAVRSVAFASVAAGASQSALLPFTVTSGAAAPPDGTVIGFTVDDTARAGSVARAIVARSAGRAELKLSTAQATVAPGGALAYTLSFHNPQAPLADVDLGMAVPAGATFVSADDGVTPDADGVVHWTLGALANGASGSKTINLTANAAAVAPLLVEATLRETATAAVLAEASAATPIDPAPAFSYSLTTSAGSVGIGQPASFTLTLTNLTNTVQNATMAFRIPDFTTYGPFGAGAVRTVAFSNVAAGAAMGATIPLQVSSGAQAPPSGTLIDLTTTDGARGATVSRTIVVN